MGDRRLIAVDCETDPFLNKRVPVPFIWGAWDGKRYRQWYSTDDFVFWLKRQNCYAYAHNGGKFDFMFLMSYLKSCRAKIINGRIAEMPLGRARLRDSFSIIPQSMKSIEKEEIDYWKLEKSVREKHKEEIEAYLQSDCVNLYNMVKKFREIAGTQLTIAGNALKNSRKLGVDPGRTGYRFDREFREFYFGGRTENFQPGTHRKLKIIDIVSSYPRAMKELHPSGDDRDTWRGEGIQDELNRLIKAGELGRAFIELECFSKGAFPLKNEADGALGFPHEKNIFKITGWEYLIARKHGLISEEKLISITTFWNTIDFTPYIDKWFDYKSSLDKETQIVEYTIAKINLNSLYGKCSQDPTKFYDYEMHPCGTEVDIENGFELYTENFMGTDDKKGIEIHRRDAMWKYKSKYGDEWTKYVKFYNVATGASITGYARAALLDAIHTVGADNVIYCDTDSLIMHDCDISGLSLGKELGQWESEGDALIGHFAGKKMYGLKLKEIDKKTGRNKYKIASKGCKISYDHIQAEINSARGRQEQDEFNKELGFNRLERIVNGETIEIINPAPSFSIANGVKFVPRSIRATSRIEKGL